jgi:hypothetical protein
MDIYHRIHDTIFVIHYFLFRKIGEKITYTNMGFHLTKEKRTKKGTKKGYSDRNVFHATTKKHRRFHDGRDRDTLGLLG